MKKALLNMLFPQEIKCIVCDSELSGFSDNGLCKKCSLLQNTSFCYKCGRAKSNDARFCLDCQNYAQNYDLVRAPLIYEDKVRQLVYKLKFGNGRYLAPFLSKYMAECFIKGGLDADFITFVPLHKRKQKRRGYNQAQLLSNELSVRLNLPVFDILDKVKDFKTNTANMRKFQRRELIKDSIEVILGIDFKGKNILLVDDVFTTGTTANECAGKLKGSGAGKVNVLTFATSRLQVKLC